MKITLLNESVKSRLGYGRRLSLLNLVQLTLGIFKCNTLTEYCLRVNAMAVKYWCMNR